MKMNSLSKRIRLDVIDEDNKLNTFASVLESPHQQRESYQHCFVDIKQENELDIEEDRLDFDNSPSEDKSPSGNSSLSTVTDDDIMITYPHDIPDCWSENQCNNFKLVNRWLIVKNGKLGCKSCMNVQNWQKLELGMRLPTLGWRTGEISYGGKTLETRQSSLRKKIFEHKNSKAHVQAVSLEENIDKMMVDEQLSKFKHGMDAENLRTIFKSVYKIAKEKRPFTDFNAIYGALVSRRRTSSSTSTSNCSLNTEKLFPAILSYTAAELKKIMVNELLAKAKKISVIMHESGMVSKKPNLAIHLRAHFDERNFDESNEISDTLFFDFIELSTSGSEEIVVSFLNCLQKNNISKEYLKRNLIGFTFNRNSVTLGRSATAVASTLKKFFPDTAIRYNFNPRLETVINNLYREFRISNVKAFVKTSLIADAIFVNVVGPPLEQFNPTEMIRNWMNDDNLTNWAAHFFENKVNTDPIPTSTMKKISNDLALASENQDEERLVIDLKPESKDIDVDEPMIDGFSETNSCVAYNSNSIGGANRNKRRGWRQINDRELIERLIQQVKEVTDYSANEDKDRLFLLSLLPFMKQLDSQENLDFRMEVQQMLQRKLQTKSEHRNNNY